MSDYCSTTLSKMPSMTADELVQRSLATVAYLVFHCMLCCDKLQRCPEITATCILFLFKHLYVTVNSTLCDTCGPR